MINNLDSIDLAVALILLIFLLGASIYVAFRKKSSENYFMAGRNLKWYSVAGSIFGTNIHAQQIIGMMGIGYSIGFAQSHYEILAVPAIFLLVYVFLPAYRKRKYFTLSQYLEERYDHRTRAAYVCLMLAFILISLTAGFYIGSRTLGLLLGPEFTYLQGILIIALVTIVLTFFGGMDSVVVADNILTILMILSVISMGVIMYSRPEIKGITGLLQLDGQQPEELQKIHLYLPANHPKLPWPGMFTGLMILQFFYWTTNQYQVQRVLAAETEKDARIGSFVAGFLKLLIPFFSIMVGVAAYYFYMSKGDKSVLADDVFLHVLSDLVPSGTGLSGLILAGLICAIFSAIYSMMNSASTMLAFDVYGKYLAKEVTEKKLVWFGRLAVPVICFMAAVLAYFTYSPTSAENFFLILADRLSYLKPGLVVVFLFGIFSKQSLKASSWKVLLFLPLFGFFLDDWYARLAELWPSLGRTFGFQLNFLYRVFLLTVIGAFSMFFLGRLEDRSTLETSLRMEGKVIWKYLFQFTLVQTPFLLLLLFDLGHYRLFAWPAALSVFLLIKKEAPRDHLLALTLTAAMTWILYYFA